MPYVHDPHPFEGPCALQRCGIDCRTFVYDGEGKLIDRGHGCHRYPLVRINGTVVYAPCLAAPENPVHIEGRTMKTISLSDEAFTAAVDLILEDTLGNSFTACRNLRTLTDECGGECAGLMELLRAARDAGVDIPARLEIAKKRIHRTETDP